jgi:hypothetical protein
MVQEIGFLIMEGTPSFSQACKKFVMCHKTAWWAASDRQFYGRILFVTRKDPCFAVSVKEGNGKVCLIKLHNTTTYESVEA